MKLFSIPNFFTLANLFCGLMGLFILMIKPEINQMSLYFLLGLLCLALVFDFFDGLLARALKQNSKIGVQLDSFADAISFGVFPAFLLLIHFSSSEIEYWIDFFSERENLIGILYPVEEGEEAFEELNLILLKETILPRLIVSLSCLLIPMFSVLRLAKFNVEQSNMSYFKGLPTPANAILIFSMVFSVYLQPDEPLVQYFFDPWFIVGFILVDSLLLISNIPLFSFKLKLNKLSLYTPQLLFIVILMVLTFFLHWFGLFLSLILYLQLSLIFRKKIECQ